ncbi:MAG: hypothetical protein JXX28_06520 [Deltaproteobacteria bacterium]|nr:hypothetical protein [Deltaproteobacteria bacterium]
MSTLPLEDWPALRLLLAEQLFHAWREARETPPTAPLAAFSAARDEVRALVLAYVVRFDRQALWEPAVRALATATQAVAAALGAAGAPEALREELSAICPVWARWTEPLAEELIWLDGQEERDLHNLQVAVVQAFGISGLRPTLTPKGLRVDVSPEPAELLAMFFGLSQSGRTLDDAIAAASEG